jgi:hypothetical protein
MKSGNLKFLEPSGPPQACNGTDLPYMSVCSITVMPRLTSFCPETQYIKPSRQIYVRRWRYLKGCWTPSIRNSRSNILLNFGSKATLKKLRNFSLNLRRLRWQLQSWLGASTHWSWCQLPLGHWTGNKQQLDSNYLDTSLLWGYSAREGEVFVSLDVSVWFPVIVT